jgi:hypothetical protein
VASEGDEKVAPQTKSVPQRLKPHCKENTFGTAEAVPLSKTDFSAPSKPHQQSGSYGAASAAPFNALKTFSCKAKSYLLELLDSCSFRQKPVMKRKLMPGLT